MAKIVFDSLAYTGSCNALALHPQSRLQCSSLVTWTGWNVAVIDYSFCGITWCNFSGLCNWGMKRRTCKV